MTLILAIALSGCSGLFRLNSYSREQGRQQRAERSQKENYTKLKTALMSGLKDIPKDTVIKKYGEPVLSGEDKGKKVLIYKEGFSLCSEKAYLGFDESDILVSYSIVKPCSNQ